MKDLYSIPARPEGNFASRLEADWAREFAAWGLVTRYVGDVVPHFDFVGHVGRAHLAIEIKPWSGKGELVDQAVGRFARRHAAARIYDWSLPSGRVPADRLLVIAGQPGAARIWFAAEIASGVWQAIRVGPPMLVLTGQPGGDVLKWPVQGGARHAVDPVGSWLVEARARAARPMPAEAATEVEPQRRLFA